MKLIDLPAGPLSHDTRGRNVTRPLMTTILMILIAIMISLDVMKRRKRLAAQPAA